MPTRGHFVCRTTHGTTTVPWLPDRRFRVATAAPFMPWVFCLSNRPRHDDGAVATPPTSPMAQTCCCEPPNRRFWCIKSTHVAHSPSSAFGPSLFCHSESSPHARTPETGRVPACSGGHERIPATAWVSPLWLRADAGPLARADLNPLPADDLTGGPKHQMAFGACTQCRQGRLGARLAAPVLGPFRPPPEGIHRPARLYAPEPGAEGPCDEARRMEMVQP